MKKTSADNNKTSPVLSADKPAGFPEGLNDTHLLELLKVTADLASDEVFWIKPNSEIIYVNSAASEKLQYHQDDLIGMHAWELDPNFSKEKWSVFSEELKAEKFIEFEAVHQNKKRENFPVNIKAHHVVSGGQEFIFAFVSDITEIKIHEQKLEAHGEKIKSILEQEKKKFSEFVNLAPIGIAINQLDDGRFDYINAEFSRFSGYSIEELNNMDYWQLTPSQYEAQEQKQLADMIEKGRYGPYQKEYIHKNGQKYPVLLSGIKITELDGKDYIWSIVQDISLQKEIEAKIQAAKEKADSSALRMQLANDSAGIGVWEWNIDTGVLIWDDWMYKLYGVHKSEFSGAYEAWEKGVHPDDIIEARAKLDEAIKGTGTYDLEFRIVRPDEQVRTIKASAEIIRNEPGKGLHVVGVNYDITDKVTAMNKLAKAKQEAENAAKAKSNFLANMSHEIRTPMNAILGGLQLLRTTKLDDDLKVILDNASYSAKSLLTIINDILDYSKIESNKLLLEQAPFSLIEVLDSVKYDLDALVSKKAIDFSAIVEDNFEDGWIGDLVRVKQILLNLVSNAVKFTDKGTVTVELSTVNHNDKNAISIRIIDSGIGMSIDAKNNIFKRFTQADTSTTRKYGGTGLGMSITMNLVNMMNGTIDVLSTLGKGTDILVILPLQKAETDTTGNIHKSLSAPNMSGKKILIAEDNKINQVLIKTILKETQADLTLVSNGKLALEAVENSDFDLVLMDIHMPEMDGVEAQQQIKQIKNHIPVIALTANVMVDDVKGYIEKGFVAHIAKPIDMNTLYGVLKGFLA